MTFIFLFSTYIKCVEIPFFLVNISNHFSPIVAHVHGLHPQKVFLQHNLSRDQGVLVRKGEGGGGGEGPSLA